jgi:hypothetical protein
VGAAVVVVAATGVAFAGDTGPSRAPDVLATPSVNAEDARGLALRYLVGRGMSGGEARQRMVNQDAALKAVTQLRRRAPSGVGSVWLDDDGNLKVRVADDAGAREVRAVGATPVFGTLASADLETVRDTLADDAVKNPPAGLSGATFEIDEAANRVIARYLFDKPGGVVPEAATELGDQVTASVEVASISPQADVHVAGARMYVSNSKKSCTAAWAVDITVSATVAPKSGVLTAGHCFKRNSPPEQTKYNIDTTVAGDTPSTGVLFAFDERGDYGVLELGNGDRGRTTMADTLRVVEAVQEPVVGAVICKYGAKTTHTCGKIQRVDISVLATVSAGGTRVLLKGMTHAEYCAEVHDSGGPVFAELANGGSDVAVAAIGVHSSSIIYPDARGKGVCGEKVDQPNDAYFTPVSGIDTEGKFRIRIDGG